MKEFFVGILKWFFTDSGQTAIAGFLGGLARWITFKEPLLEGLASLFVGAVTAYYMVPLVAPWFVGDIEHSPAMFSAVAYIIGVSGVLFVGGIIDWVRKVKELRQGGDKK